MPEVCHFFEICSNIWVIVCFCFFYREFFNFFKKQTRLRYPIHFAQAFPANPVAEYHTKNRVFKILLTLPAKKPDCSMYLYWKALHIVFMVTWFAGLFYIVRLFIYYAEAGSRKESDRKLIRDQLTLMARRLWAIITWPGMLLTVATGTALILSYPDLLKEGWLHIKLTLVLCLIAYHLVCGKMVTAMKTGAELMNPEKLRIMNEVPTLFLFAIVFLAILKNTLSLLFALAALFGLGILLMIGIKVYKRLRKDPVV